MISWYHYPRSLPPAALSLQVVGVFEGALPLIDSAAHKKDSNTVLGHVAEPLRKLGFQVERGKCKEDRLPVPVLFGRNGAIEKSFRADAYHPESKYMVEVEAGRAFTNYQFLKDLFQACTSDNVEYLAIAVRNVYNGHGDFDSVAVFLDSLYASHRLHLPLKGLLLVGY